MEISLETVHKDIEELRKAVIAMQETIVDRFLTSEEEENLEIGLKELEEGKAISLKDLERERRNVRN